jgi:hypothetical protein
MMIPRRLPVALLLILFPACGGDRTAADLPSATVRDSSGIRIVENHWSETPVPGWALAPEPDLVIGRLSGEPAYEFTRVSGASRLSDGRVAVMDGAVSELRIYGPDGVHVRTLGRKGNGPEEFASPSLAGRLPGDTLLVFDTDRRWLAFVHPEGGFGRSFTLGEEAGDFVSQLGLLGEDAMAFGGGMFFSSEGGFPEGRTRPNSTYGTVRLDGSPGMSLGRIPAAEMWGQAVEGGFTALRLPFGKLTVAAAGPDRFFLGTNESWDILVFDAEGRLVSRIRTDRAPEEVTEALRQAYIEVRLADADDEADRTAIRARYRDIPFGETLPHYELLRADATGHLWVRDPTLPGEDAGRYAVFDPAGRLLGTMTLPPRVFPLEIGEDYLLGRTEDELGVQTIVLYALSRGA